MSHATICQPEILDSIATPTPVSPEAELDVNFYVAKGIADGFYKTVNDDWLHKTEYCMGVNIGQLQRNQGARTPLAITPAKRGIDNFGIGIKIGGKVQGGESTLIV